MVAIPRLHYHWGSFRANPFSGYVLMHFTLRIGRLSLEGLSILVLNFSHH